MHFSVIGIVYIMPILIVLINSFKNKVFINKEPFTLPTKQTWVGIDNFLSAIDKYELLSAVGWTVFITVGSVLVILVCTSMCAWYITRVNNKFTKMLYFMCIFHGCTVPDGYVHLITSRPYRASYTLGNHYYLPRIWCRSCGIYVLRICKIIPLEIEEAAMIDGCTPLRDLLLSCISNHEADIHFRRNSGEAMWIWNDYPASLPGTWI